MAFKQVMGSSGYRKASDLATGDSVEGYLIGLPETKFNFAIALLDKEGRLTKLTPNGNLNYIGEEIEEGNVTLNVYTRILRTGTRQSTKARDPQTGEWRQVPVFKVEQDSDDIITAEQAAEALAADTASANAADSEDAGASSAKSGVKLANRKR